MTKYTLEDYNLSRSEWINLAEEYLFNKRDRQIFIRRYLDGVKFEDLADEFELSVRHVKTISYKTMYRVSLHIFKPIH